MQETYVFKFISLGESVGAKEINVDQEMIDHYAVSSLDYNPVHTNLPWAEQAQIFGKPSTVAHGMMTLSFMTTVLYDWCINHNSIISEMEVKFTSPVWPGEKLIIEGYVKEIHPVQSFVVISLRVINLQGEIKGASTAKVNIP